MLFRSLDIGAEKVKPDFRGLQEIHRRKTGALLTASVKAGAILAGAGEQKISALAKFGHHVGMAFQIADDVLNIEGDAELMGKSTGSDAAMGKVTYPSLLGLDAAKTNLAQHVEQAIDSIDAFDARALPLRVIARYIMDRKM